MTSARARDLINMYVPCTGLPFAFDKGWGYAHELGITRLEDFTIVTILLTLPDHMSYYDALTTVARRGEGESK